MRQSNAALKCVRCADGLQRWACRLVLHVLEYQTSGHFKLASDLELREQVEMLGHIRAHKHRHHLMFKSRLNQQIRDSKMSPTAIFLQVKIDR